MTPTRSALRLGAIVAFASAGVLVCASAALAAPECAVSPGGHVTLASDAVDPDVFLWDSKERLVDYAAGQWGSTRAIIAHTLLAEPGTQAVIVACVSSAAHPRYASGNEDAVGVRITSGPHRGRYGWILSSDIRSLQEARGPSPVPSKTH